MADSNIPPPIECFVGSPSWNGTQWVCPSDLTKGGNQPPLQQPMPQPPLGTVQPVITTPTINIFSSNGILGWIQQHPYLVVGGAVLLYWLLFMKGGSSIRSRFSR